MKLLNPSPWQRPHIFGTAFLLASLATSTWASVGQFQFVSGDVRIVAPDGHERQAQKGGEINEGESVVSAKGSTAQLRMADGGIIAIRQDSKMRIDEFRFNGQEDGSERSFFSLVKGGFRSITGSVGKLHKENYRIKTPAATIGIRGTDSETMHISAQDAHLPDVPAGTYNRVNTGATIVNGMLVQANQVAYAPNLDTTGTLLPKAPQIFAPPKPEQTSATNTQKPADKSTASTVAPTTTNTESTTTATTEPIAPPPPDGTALTTSIVLPPPPSPTTTLVGTTSSIVPASSTYAAPFGYGGVGGDISWRTDCLATGGCKSGWASGNGSLVLEPNLNRTILLNSSGFPVLIAQSDAFGSMQYSAGTASLLDFGQTAAAGTTVRWGRYVGADSFIDGSGTRDPLVMNLMWADNALSFIQAQTALTSVTTPVNFNLVSGAGTVVDELNNTYHLINGNLQVGAGGTSIKLHVITDTIANRSWDLTYASSVNALSQFYNQGSATGPSGLPLDQTASSMKVGATPVPVNMGNASGVFIGSQAAGAVSSFSANVGPSAVVPSGAFLSGTALLAR